MLEAAALETEAVEGGPVGEDREQPRSAVVRQHSGVEGNPEGEQEKR